MSTNQERWKDMDQKTIRHLQFKQSQAKNLKATVRKSDKTSFYYFIKKKFKGARIEKFCNF